MRCNKTKNIYKQCSLSNVRHLHSRAYKHIYPIICLKSVEVRRLQVVILALSPREMFQTDRILPRYILSRVCVSVRPRIFFIREKTANHSRPHTSIRAAEINNGIGSRRTEATRWCTVIRRAVDYDVTRCECREPGSNPMQGTIFVHFYCLRLTRLTLNKS